MRLFIFKLILLTCSFLLFPTLEVQAKEVDPCCLEQCFGNYTIAPLPDIDNKDIRQISDCFNPLEATTQGKHIGCFPNAGKEVSGNMPVRDIISEALFPSLAAATASAEPGDIFEVLADHERPTVVMNDAGVIILGNNFTITPTAGSGQRGISISAPNVFVEGLIISQYETFGILAEEGSDGLNIPVVK